MASTRHAFTLSIGALARSRFMALMAALALLVALAATATAPLPAAAKDSNQKWGKRLVDVYELPSEALAKFSQFQEKKGASNAATPRGMMPDTLPWTGSEVALGTSGNPYTLVVRVSGVALADGDASTMWFAGWSMDGAARTGLVPQVSAKGVRAGQALEMVGAGAPLSFKEDRKVQPVLEFANSRNVRIDRVRLELWSGIRPSTFLELFMSWIPLFTGVVFLALFWWWRRR